jgi:hypothetical protein
MVKQAEIEIGGQLIDRQYGDWMNIWTELTVPAGKRDGYDNMVGNAVGASSDQVSGLNATTGPYRLYVPLQFWFNRNPGLALPLIALQYHEVKLNLELRSLAECITGNTSLEVNGNGLSAKLYVDYVYLDTDERRRFAQVSHEYLIEQVQFTGTETVANGSSNKNVTLNFNHPVKELIWACTTTMVNGSIILVLLPLLVVILSPQHFSSLMDTTVSLFVMPITFVRFKTTNTTPVFLV